MAYTTIDDPSAHFHIQLYTGNGSSGHAITNDANAGDFQPDWVWIKNRGAGGHNMIFDSTRGATKAIYTNLTNAEGTVSGHLTAFDSDGFTLGDNSGVGSSNGNTETYVAWQWKANGGTRTTFTESGSNMGGGYQVNTTAGFSIVDYVGTGSAGYFSHGLGAAPECIIIKNRSYAGGWRVWSHKLSGVTYRLYLHGNNAESSGWDSWTIGSSTVTLGTDGSVNRDGDNHIAYCFRSIQGYSKFGSYTGNNNASGPFVYLGFKPAFLMFKRTSGTEDWGIVNIKSSPRAAGTETNDMAYELEANENGAEANQIDFWFLSNGFKIDGSGNFANGDGETYIYAAFAEQPFVSSGGVPCTAF